MKTVHIAEMISDGGRDGKVEMANDGFSVQLSSDEKPDSITPEHLFAGAYAACFHGALKNAAESAHLPVEDLTVLARAHLDEDDRGGYRFGGEFPPSVAPPSPTQAHPFTPPPPPTSP